MFLLQRGWKSLCQVLALILPSGRQHKRTATRQPSGFRTRLESLEQRAVLNAAPIVEDSWPTIDEDASTTFGGYDDDNDPLTAEIVSGPSNGTAAVNPDGTITYSPSADFNGSDSFQYKVSDGLDESSIATVSLTVSPVNDAPWASDDSWSVWINHQDTDPFNFPEVNGAAFGDIDGDTLQLAFSSTPPATLAPGESGSIGYTVTDTSGATASATFAFAVNYYENHAPSAGDDEVSTDEDASVSFDPRGNDYDDDNDALGVPQIESGPSHGSVEVDEFGTITYLPEQDFNGSDAFSYRVDDGWGGSTTATVSIQVNPVNDTPWANDDHWETWITHQQTEWHEFPGVNPEAYGDVDGDSLELAIVPSPPAWLMPGESCSVQYTVTDPWGASATATFSFAVNYFENHAPSAVVDEITTDEDTSVRFDPRDNDSDEDGDGLSAPLIESGPQHGTVWVDEFGMITYQPEQDYHGYDSIVYRVDDGWGAAATATVVFTINSVNDTPIAGDSAWTIDEDTTFSVSGSDVDGDPLVAVVISDPSHGTLTHDGAMTLVYTPHADYYGEDSFQYVVNDGQVDSDVATVYVAINSINDAPVAVDDYFEQEEDTSITFSAADLLANDYDVDGDTLSINAIYPPSNGELIDHGDGTYTYTPSPDYNGPDAIGYEITDGYGAFASATVQLNMMPVADAPRPGDDYYGLNEDEAIGISAGELLANDYEPDGEPLNFVGVVEGPYNGQLIDIGGTFIYTPNQDFNGTDYFTYSVEDSTGLASSAVVWLTINPVNDAPVVIDEWLEIDEDTSLTVGGSDVDGDSLAAFIIAEPEHGTLQVNPDGTVTYTPHPDYFGADSFQYQVTDVEYNSGIATVEITVHPVNDAPSFLPGSNVTVDEDAAPYSEAWASETTAGPENESDQELTYVVQNNNSTLFTAGGQPKIAADGTLTFTPAPNAYGTAAVTVYLRDNGGTERGGIDVSATHSFNITLEPVNDPPVNVLPSAPLMPAGSNLVFSTANGNRIAVQDDSVLPIQVMLVVNQGTLSLSRTTGLTFLTGDGSQDWFVCFTGTVTNVNAALNGLTFHSPMGYLGNVDLTMATQDLGGTGKGVAQADFDVLKIRALPMLSVSGQTVNETDGSVTFTVELSQASGEVITVDYGTSDGTASSSDYTSDAGTLTFESGETSKTVTISITDDSEIELDEEFYLSLSNPANALIATGSAQVTILSEDAAELAIDDAIVDEDAGFVSVTFRLNRADHLGVSFNYGTEDDTAVSPDDYLGSGGQIVFAPGESEKTVVIPIVDDFLDEPDETFRVIASDVANAVVIDGEATVTIVDNDIPPVLTVDDVAVYEYAGVAYVTFKLDHGAHPGVTFDFSTFDGSAVHPDDYLESIGQLYFATGETEKTVEITIVDDEIREPDEDFTVQAMNVSGATVADDTSKVTILSRSELTFADIEVGEGEGFATITFRLNRPDPNGLSFNYTTFDDLAVSPYDYHGESGGVTFGPDEIEKTIQIQIVDDSWDERTRETFFVAVTNPERVLFVNDFSVVTIVDNDLMGVVGYSDPPTIDEGDNMFLHGAVIADVTWGSYHYDIDWGDGATTSGDLLPGITFFNRLHRYEDDGFYFITITATNPDGESNFGIATCMVLNRDPSLEVGWIPDIYEGATDGFAGGTVYDPGELDLLTVVMYIDGVATASQELYSGGSFWFSYSFDDDDLDGSDDPDGPTGTANIDFRVFDGDGGEDSESGTITVHNVDPEATGGTLGGTYTACEPPTEEDIFAIIGITDPGSDDHYFSVGDLPTDVGTHTVTVTVEDDDSGSTTVDVTYEIVRRTETTQEEDDLEAYDLDGDGISEYEDYDGDESFHFSFYAQDDDYDLDIDGLPPAGANVLDNDSATVSRSYTHYNYSRTLHRTIDACTGEVLEEWSEIHESSEDLSEELGAATLTAAPGFAPTLAKDNPAWDVYSDGTFTYEQDLSNGGPEDDAFGVTVYATYTYEGEEHSDSAETCTYLHATDKPGKSEVGFVVNTHAVEVASPGFDTKFTFQFIRFIDATTSTTTGIDVKYKFTRGTAEWDDFEPWTDAGADVTSITRTAHFNAPTQAEINAGFQIVEEPNIAVLNQGGVEGAETLNVAIQPSTNGRYTLMVDDTELPEETGFERRYAQTNEVLTVYDGVVIATLPANGAKPGENSAVYWNDLDQVLGNCYLIAAMMAAAMRDPNQLQNMIQQTEDGYLVFFPTTEAAVLSESLDRGPDMVNIGVSDVNAQGQVEIWSVILETAYARTFVDGWENIGNGDAAQAYNNITGRYTTDIFPCGDVAEDNFPDEPKTARADLIAAVQAALTAGKPVMMSVGENNGGLTEDHVYLVTAITETQITLIDPNNPVHPSDPGVLQKPIGDWIDNGIKRFMICE